MPSKGKECRPLSFSNAVNPCRQYLSAASMTPKTLPSKLLSLRLHGLNPHLLDGRASRRVVLLTRRTLHHPLRLRLPPQPQVLLRRARRRVPAFARLLRLHNACLVAGIGREGVTAELDIVPASSYAASPKSAKRLVQILIVSARELEGKGRDWGLAYRSSSQSRSSPA